MSRYTGFLCESCKQPLKNDDDVVVCPDCGAPHHRSCYDELGHCALNDKHSAQFVWKAELPKSDGDHQTGSVLCSQCNSLNPSNSKYCQMCGKPLGSTNDSYASYGQYTNPTDNYAQSNPNQAFSGTSFSEQWDINGITSQELSAYTGNNSYYFLHQFKILMSNKFNMSWNWAALIFNFFYFFYRKMYKVGIALLAFYIVSLFPSVLCYFGPTDATIEMMGMTIGYNSSIAAQTAPIISILNVMRIFINVWCAIFANKLYLKTTLKNITRYKNIVGNREGTPEYYNGLYFYGRPNRLAVVLLLFGIFAIYTVLGNFMSWKIV